MKKIFSIIVLSMMTIFSLTFVSCSNDDDKQQSSSNSIVGTWSLTDYGDYTITFKSDGTGFDAEKGDVDTFTYSINGNTLIIRYDDYSEAYIYKYEITNDGNTLILYEDEEEGYSTEKYVRKS